MDSNFEEQKGSTIKIYSTFSVQNNDLVNLNLF